MALIPYGLKVFRLSCAYREKSLQFIFLSCATSSFYSSTCRLTFKKYDSYFKYEVFVVMEILRDSTDFPNLQMEIFHPLHHFPF